MRFISVNKKGRCYFSRLFIDRCIYLKLCHNFSHMFPDAITIHELMNHDI